MKKLLLATYAALALGAVDANAQSADYHKASPLEQAKAAYEIYADTCRGAQICLGGPSTLAHTTHA
jgi:hypothetical protein